MTIYRPDGKPYNPTGSLQQFDDGLPERDLFNKWDEESIRLGGSPLFYYELLLILTTLIHFMLRAEQNIQ